MAGRENAGRVAVRCLIGVVGIAASLAFVWICKRLVDIATGNIDADLRVNIGLMVAIMLVQLSNNILASYYEGLILVRIENNLRGRLFQHVMRSRWNGRDALHSGDTVNRLETDIYTITELIATRLPDIIITLGQLVCASVFLFMMKPGLLWVLLAIMVVAVVSSRLCFFRIRKLSAEIRAKDAQVQSFMQENLLHRVLALTLIGVDRVTGRMDQLQGELYDVNVKRLNFNSVARVFMSLGFAAGYLSAFLWGVLGIRSGAVTFGMMTAFLQLVGQVQGPISQIARYIPSVIHSLASVDRLSELEDLETEPTEGNVLLQGLPGIQVDNVTFGYEKDKPVIENFSCTFQPGSMTAVMGPTGAGKSTLIRLILGLMTPEKGSIRIYDENMTVDAGPSARCNFMYVPQGNSMMSGSIRDNFLLANPEATESDMTDALRHACAQFVLELPDGLDTVCSELGAGLSEGQAQRIAIARALLHKGQILILDESTSALDSTTEDHILSDIRQNLQGKRTIIFITHRKTVADVADAVVDFGDRSQKRKNTHEESV
ncbi:MAG: ABC transporter ATP-binding protein/permease [Bacteroidaceae bacterium]|nr:ABC transporter ATP-binding protein/permease [Bacteroidaceae bacterium]